MKYLSMLRQRVVLWVVKHPRYALAIAVAGSLALGTLEHLVTMTLGENAHLLFDGLLYVLLIPVLTYFFLNMLVDNESARIQATQAASLGSEFSKHLGDARSWEELTRRMVEYANQVAPGAAVSLFTVHPGNSVPHLDSACSSDGKITMNPAPAQSLVPPPSTNLHELILEADREANPVGGKIQSGRYDLPISRNEQLVGVLRIDYAAGSTPSADEIRALRAAEPVMALALEGAMLQRMAVEQAAATEAERQQIAQNLHDTLAQNISYLRLKLDQLTGVNTIREIGAVLQELERMRATADESYQQVRNTLDELNPIHAEDLVTTLDNQARVISQRAGFQVRTSQVGSPYAFPPATRQQIHYIVREALHNIEKHARAKRVHMQYLWLENEFILKVTDDGVGFNPRSISGEGHYGLWIMQHRAQEIGGGLQISLIADENQQPNGTEVTLWVPRTAPVPTRQAESVLEIEQH